MSDHANFDDPIMANFLAAYEITAEIATLSAIFYPGLLEKRFAAFRDATRFVHYTTAEAVTSIIRNKSVWLRNANAMNDYSELHHGNSRVTSFFRSDAAKPFWTRLEELHPGLDQEVRELYDSWVNDLRFNTYMICVSEHQPDEDAIGRLSMWRAYGQPNSVALVINAKAFHSSSDAISTFSHPVFYLFDTQVESLFNRLVANVASSKAVAAMPRDELKSFVHNMLEAFSIGLKHPGFREELEWRVVHRPGPNPNQRVVRSVQTVRGVPQRVYSLPLQNIVDENLRGLEIHELVDRIVVGPCQHPFIIRDALIDELNSAGVVDAASKVIVSNIPLRT